MADGSERFLLDAATAAETGCWPDTFEVFHVEVKSDSEFGHAARRSL